MFAGLADNDGFLVHVKVLARLFRGKFLAMLIDAHCGGQLKFFDTHAGLADKRNSKKSLVPLRRIKWVVYCKEPFAGPQQVLRYLSRYIHHCHLQSPAGVRQQERRQLQLQGLSDPRAGPLQDHDLTTDEFIRRFLIHLLPEGVHRIRRYGLLASANRAANIARARELLAVPTTPRPPETPETAAADEPRILPRPCPCCGGRMVIIETFARGCEPKHRPEPSLGEIRIDTS